MGWNGWTTFECAPELDEVKVREMVDVMVDSGMQTAGYTYVNLDRCWGDARDENGDIVLDTARLPNGIDAFSDDLHARGFKLGFHRHTAECADVPEGHEAADAAKYAQFGVDFLKLVSCQVSSVEDVHGARAMAEALRESGRDVLVSLALPPFQEWMRDVGQISRTDSAIVATWPSILAKLDATTPLAAYARPGAFLDPDFLVAGIGALSESEQRAQFSLWSILSAPLLASNDLTQMSEVTRSILTNQDVIALNQDPLALQAAQVRKEGDLEVFAKPLAECGARGVVLFNRGENSVTTTLSWPEIWLPASPTRVLDLWSQEELESDRFAVEITIPPHDVRVLKVVGVEPAISQGEARVGDAAFSYATNGYGPVERNTTNGEQLAGDGQPLRMRGQAYADGLGVHPPSLIRFRLGGVCSRFTAQVGIDDEGKGLGTVIFQVWSDGEKLFDSGVMTGKTPPQQVDVSLENRMDLRLFVATTGDDFFNDHSDWAEARLWCDPEMSAR